MKKFFYVMTEIILFLISVIVFTKPALADVNYDITNVDVTARVNPNGSLSMERRITSISSKRGGILSLIIYGEKDNL